MLELTISILIAQVPPTGLDGIAGGAGWVGASLLGGVLSWLLFIHLPNKDKQIAGLIETRDALVTGLSSANQEAIRAMTSDFRTAIVESERRADSAEKERREDYKSSLQMVITHYEKEISVTNAAIRRDLDELNSVLAELRKLIAEVRDKNMQLWSAPEPRRRPGPNPPPAPPSPGR